jgi:pilus assembly protein Flp/PilA
MTKFYIKGREAILRVRTDKNGVVSFEYVIVAACVVGAVVLAFGTGAGGAIATALGTAITAIVTQVTAATA